MNSNDSSSDCVEILYNNSPSPMKRKHEDDDEEVSNTKARRRKILKTTFLSPSSSTKMIWTRNDQLIILAGIVDYEIEKQLRYQEDWDALYNFIKGSIESKFTKTQLRDKIRGLKKRFTDNMGKSEDGKGPSFTNTEDDEIFKLSMIIWAAKKEEEFGVNEVFDQKKDESLDQGKDAPYEPVNENVDQAKVDAPYVEHVQVNENIDQAKVDNDVSYAEHEQGNESMDQAKVDVSCVEQEQERVSNISMEIDDGEKEKRTEEDGVDEFCLLQEAFEEILVPTLGKTHQKLLLRNLKNLEAEKGKELSDEWKALVFEEVQLHVKKLAFSTKLANAIVSA